MATIYVRGWDNVMGTSAPAWAATPSTGGDVTGRMETRELKGVSGVVRDLLQEEEERGTGQLPGSEFLDATWLPDLGDEEFLISCRGKMPRVRS